MKRILSLFFAIPALCFGQVAIGGSNQVSTSNNPGSGGGSGPYSPSSFTQNALLFGNGTGPILSSGSTTDANGDILTPSIATIGHQFFNTADQVTNFEQAQMSWIANVFTIGFNKGGTGSSRVMVFGGGLAGFKINTPVAGGIIEVGNSQTSGLIQYNSGTTGTPGSIGHLFTSGNTAGSGVAIGIELNPTYNQTSTAGSTDLLINRSETAVGSGNQYFQDWQISGVSQAHLDHGGNLALGGKMVTYGGIATAGIGTTPVVSSPRTAANTNALWAPAAYTTPAVDTSYEVSANINVTATTAAAMTCTCTYTDETNTSRTLTLGFTQLAGATLLTSITNVTGTGPYESVTYHIRCKASTTITFATVGTVTGITYNAEASVVQLQ